MSCGCHNATPHDPGDDRCEEGHRLPPVDETTMNLSARKLTIATAPVELLREPLTLEDWQVKKLAAYVPVSTEQLIDAGIVEAPEGYSLYVPPKVPFGYRVKRFIPDLIHRARHAIGSAIDSWVPADYYDGDDW